MRVYIHGNCQAIVARKMLMDLMPDWKVSAFEVHGAEIVDKIDEYHRFVREADIILSQPVHALYRDRDDLSIKWIKAETRAAVIVVPAMHFEGHHLGGYHLGGFGPSGRNALVAQMIAAGLAADAAADLLMSPDLLGAECINREIEVSLEEMRRRETLDEIDIPLSAMAPHFAGNHQAFHTVNHPMRPLYVYMLNKALDALGIGGHRFPCNGPDYQPIPHLPLLPSIVSNAPPWQPLPGWDTAPDDVVRFPGLQPMPQRAFLGHIARHFESFGAAAVLTGLRECWRSGRFLRRLARWESRVPGLDIWREEV